MKIKLAVSDERYTEVSSLLRGLGLELDDDAEFVLIERNRHPSHLGVKTERGERAHIPTEDIILIEVFGHSVEVVTEAGRFRSSETLGQLALMLDPTMFLRISNSVIIRKNKVKRIDPSFSMKFTLEMQNGQRVDVTRSYYAAFREFFRI